jgi:hypothetical protein
MLSVLLMIKQEDHSDAIREVAVAMEGPLLAKAAAREMIELIPCVVLGLAR